MSDALISIKPQFVGKILSGRKSIEIRNRTVILSPGTRLWIYNTLPIGRIDAVALVDFVETGSPSAIWKRFHEKIGISAAEFQEYINQSSRVSAISLIQACRVSGPLTLTYLRSAVPGFHPPQFIKHIPPSDLLWQVLASHARPEHGLTPVAKKVALAIG